MLKRFFREIRATFTIPPRAITPKELEARRKESVKRIVRNILMNGGR